MIDFGYGVSLGNRIPINAIKWRNDKAVFATCRQFTLLSQAEHDTWLESLSKNRSCKMFSINEKNVEVGVCGLTNIDWQARHAEVSLYIAPKYQGHKLAFPALKTLIHHGFEDFNLNKLWGEIFNNNTKSFKVFSKCGFVATPGHIQHYFRDGAYIDTTFVTLLAADWFLNKKVVKSQDEIKDQDLDLDNNVIVS